MTTIPIPSRSVAIRPLALPTEHGGWGFLFEPVVLGLLVAGSWGGLAIAVASIAGFLVRQPLKLALQDAMRRRSYARTMYCWILSASYALAASVALAIAVALGGTKILVPFAIVAPLAIVQVIYDARNRSRDLIAEVSGAAAMSSTAAAIAMSGGFDLGSALGISGIIVARSIPSIVYVRNLLRPSRKWLAVGLHVTAIAIVASYASLYAIAAMVMLLARAAHRARDPTSRAKIIGWREIAFGAINVALASIGYITA